MNAPTSPELHDAPAILVVDDVAANRVALRRLLKGVSATIVEAESGEAALAACLERQFALILLDVQMPDMDGFEVAELLSGQGELSDTPVIFVTANYTDDIDRLHGYKLGAVDYLTKPVNENILLAKVHAFLELYRSRAQVQRLLRDFEHVNLRLQQEIEERKRAEAEARHQAHHDPLTGLPNRASFYQQLAEALADSDSAAALIYIDLDGFKQVNDCHGHAAGDALLCAVAGRLRNAFRSDDLVARLGGDEFAVLLPRLSGEGALVRRMAQQAVDSLGRPFRIEPGAVAGSPPAGRSGARATAGNGDAGPAAEAAGGARNAEPGQARSLVVQIGASAGLAMSPEDARDVDSLVAAADAAMYRAKAAGKGQVVAAKVPEPGDRAASAPPAG